MINKLKIIDNEVITELLNIINKCYYVSIEVRETYLCITNSSKEAYNYLMNPFSKKKFTKKNIEEYIIYHITKNYLKTKTTFINDKNLQALQIENESLIILYLDDLICIKYCNNILDYITKEKNIRDSFNKKNNKKLIYYRGNKLNYDLSPSLYRNKNYIKIEHIINNRIIQNMPNDFNGCEDFFDKLTILKHFNCPSRLLDITKSSLIATFFALDNYEINKEPARYGTINLVFPKSNDQIKNARNSDSVSLLSALSTTNKNLIPFNPQELINQLKELLNLTYIKDLPYERIHERIEWAFYELQDLSKLISIEDNPEIYKLIEKFEEWFDTIDDLRLYESKISDKFYDIDFNCLIKEAIHKFNSSHFFYDELRHQASLINSSLNLYSPRINDINQYYIVHPSLNNNRIRNQQGLFILIGANQNINNHYLNSNTTYLNLFENNNKKRIVLIIDNVDNKFYNELDRTYGINKGFIYPELEHKVNQIKDDVMFEHGIKSN